MNIANRILLGFTAITLLLIGLGLYSLNQISVVTRSSEVIVTRDLAMLRKLMELQDAESSLQDARSRAVLGFLLRSLGREAEGDDAPPQVPRHAGEAERLLNEIQALASQNLANSVSQERREGWQRINQIISQAALPLRQIRERSQEQMRLIQGGGLEAVQGVSAALLPVRQDFYRLITQLQDTLNEVISTGQRRSNEIYLDSRFNVILVLISAVLLGIIITVLIRRSIVQPLSAFMGFVERVGRGDLGGAAASTGPDELGRLGGTLNAMVDGLRQLARQSREATENLNAAAAEIRASTQEQAASVEEQLAAVQETAATVDEITHSGVQIGKRAQEVIASAQATAQTSSAGLRAVDETVRAMDAIREQAEAVATNIVALSEKTQAIGEIIATVNDISERSHLLALNAAIEAAAAGEQGRSFAIVAAEMKTLADQAKEATSQVRSILGDIQRGINASVMLTEEAVKRVATGRERTDTTQSTITEISGRIQESVHTFQQIVASTNQQQLGIEQVMSALQNIRQASQQTAAGTRQLDTAAANLSQLSQQLVALADRYRL
ncbi:methyl-accepting chemotaxis protein [Pseudoroseomonas rhizosphaerae]|uniref:Methyl-accepting chemotaxis protein n=1 Tax=Teichococcus rhizosphaerae TaxID=1335062 RepID=A0A2C7ADX7_9PROT|nr:methyl-accepting chemotaxis protein [Pseudoroseomonas rhizosphaerae]PHK95284.1 methyl-accepting chemotaxis protein [Pseudoroseomonas rhizosphaerae]